jgi:hypothetical protein
MRSQLGHRALVAIVAPCGPDRWVVLATRSKSRRRREETLASFRFSEEINESRDLDSYKVWILNGSLAVATRIMQ